MMSDIQALQSGSRTLTTVATSGPSAASRTVAILRPELRQLSAAAASEASNEIPNEVSNRALPDPGRIRAEDSERNSPAEQIREAVESLNENSFNVKRSLRFDVDEETGVTVITVRDASTQEVIRQIPSEELLKLARHIHELTEELREPKGVLVSTEA